MSLQTDYAADNVFARIIGGELPAAKVYEDDDILVFMDAFPQSTGHTLVIPKKEQATNLLDASPDVLSAVIKATQNVAKAIAASLKPEGIRIVQFNGAPAGQTVFHLHFHIIPVWTDVPLGAHGGGQADMEELNRLAGMIREQL